MSQNSIYHGCTTAYLNCSVFDNNTDFLTGGRISIEVVFYRKKTKGISVTPWSISLRICHVNTAGTLSGVHIMIDFRSRIAMFDCVPLD